MNDIRPHIVADALAHPTLTPARRVFLIVATMLPAEYDDTGARRPGSKGMDSRGRFAFHYDYLAKWLHTSPGNAKRTAERLADDEIPFLQKIHPGTYGRPATWQALRVRGDWSRRITPSTTVTPYDLYAAYVRSDTESPLPYRTPTGLGPAPAAGVHLAASADAESSNEGEACRWHSFASPCPPDCADHPTNRQESA